MEDPFKKELCNILMLDTIVDIAPRTYKFMYRDFITTIKFSEETLIQISVYGSPITPIARETISIIQKLNEKFENHYITYTDNAMHVSTTTDISPAHIKEILDEINIYYTLYDYCFCLIPEPKYVSKEHYLLGAIGALIGVLPGILLWIWPLFGITSERVALTEGLLLSFGGFRFYLLFARDLPQYGWSIINALKNTSFLFGCGMTTRGLIISGTCILIAFFVAIRLDYIFYFMQLRDYSFTNARFLFYSMMQVNSEFYLKYWSHLVYCYLYAIVAGICILGLTINRMPRRM